LTDGERVTMQMIASGMPDKAIAAEQDVSVRTVQNHRASLFEKLQVTNRAELIRMAPRDAHGPRSENAPAPVPNSQHATTETARD